MKTSTKILMGVTGVLLVASGIICIIYPGSALLSLSLLLGIMILASGISTIATSSYLRPFMPTGSLVFSGILQIILGIIFINNNLVVASALPFIFAFWILSEGIILAVRSFDFKAMHFNSWWVMLVLGILAAVIGFFSLKYPFDVAGPVLCYAVGCGVIFVGVIDLVALCEINKLEKGVYGWIENTPDEQ